MSYDGSIEVPGFISCVVSMLVNLVILVNVSLIFSYSLFNLVTSSSVLWWLLNSLIN